MVLEIVTYPCFNDSASSSFYGPRANIYYNSKVRFAVQKGEYRANLLYIMTKSQPPFRLIKYVVV